MAYRAKDLCVLAYANGFTLWHYTTQNSAANVSSEGYFNCAADVLRTGDMILIKYGDETSACADILVVSSNDQSGVEVSSMTNRALHPAVVADAPAAPVLPTPVPSKPSGLDGTSGHSFSTAISAVMLGERATRSGWNGTGMWLAVVRNYAVYDIPDVDDAEDPSSAKPAPWIGMRDKHNSFSPWTPSQADMFAEDWIILA